MTRALRGSGARRPSPSRPDARGGRARARPSPLPAFALLAGALCLFPASPAAAQTVPTVVNSGMSVPTDIVVSAGDGSLTMTWTNPRSYNRGVWIQYREQGSSGWTFSSTGATSPHTQGSLTNGTTYDVRIFAVVCCNSASQTIRTRFVNRSGTPGTVAPTGLGVTAGDAKLDLSWTAPSGATGYDVHYTSAPKTGAGAVGDYADASGSDASAAWVDAGHTGTTASHTIPGLAGGAEHRVRVRAVNTHGAGAWVFDTGTPTTPPADVLVSNLGEAAAGPLTTENFVHAQGFWTGTAAGGYTLSGIEAVLGNTPGTAERNQIRAELWSAAAGGGPDSKLADLDVPSSISGGAVTSFGTSSTVTLSASTAYFFVLYTTGTYDAAASYTTSDDEDAAESGWSIRDGMWWVQANQPGSMSWATASRSMRIRVTGAQAPTAPGAVVGLSVTPGNAKLDLAWTAPEGSPTGYDVHYTSSTSVADDADASGSDASAAWVDASHTGTDAEAEITSLTNDTPYRVRVRGVNALGAGAWAFGTGTPKASTSGSTDATLSALVLKDEFAANTIGFDQTFSPTTYAYTASGSAAHRAVTVTPTVNESNASAKVGMGTSLTAVASGNTSAAINLAYGSNVIAVEVTAQAGNKRTYTITVTRELPVVQWGAAASPVAEGRTYQHRFNVDDNDMVGTVSYAAGATHPANLSTDLGSGRSTGFTMSLGDGNPSIIEVPLSDDALNEENETFTITIEPGTGYTVGSPATQTVTIVDTDPPAAPGSFKVEKGDTELTASWSAPAGPLANYQLRWKETSATDQAATTANDPSTGWVEGGNVSAATTSQTITSLTNGTSYDVQVRADDGQTATGNGWGAWTATQQGTPDSTVPPDAPTRVRVTEGVGELELSWTAPARATSYDVHYTSSQTVADDAAASGSDPSAAWVDAGHGGAAATHNIPGLMDDTDYRVRVRAENAYGAGAWAQGAGTTAPAGALWWAWLTVSARADGRIKGCGTVSGMTGCGAALTNRTIRYKTVDYNIAWIGSWTTSSRSGFFDMTFNKALPAAFRSGLTLNIGRTDTKQLALSSATYTPPGGTARLDWRSNQNLGWSNRQRVRLWLSGATLSTDATLSALAMEDGSSNTIAFDQTFSATTYAYTASVGITVDGVAVTPTVNESNATVKVGTGTSLTTVASGSASDAIDLEFGANVITVEVTAEAGNKRRYTITVNRPLPVVEWPSSTLTGAEGSTENPRVQPSYSNDMSGTLSYAAGATHAASLTDDVGSARTTAFTMSVDDTYLSSIEIPLVDDALNEENETFTVKIEAGTGYTVGSDSVMTVTITDDDPPAAPGSFAVTAGNAELRTSWSAPAGPVANYQLRWKETAAKDSAATGDGTDPSTGWVEGGNISAASTSQTIESLTNDTSYDVQVRATDGQTATGNGWGAWTATQSGTPQTTSYGFSLATYTAPPGSTFDVTVVLSEAAPTGGLALTLTPLFGTDLPTGLCTTSAEVVLAESDDVGSGLPTSVTVTAGDTEAKFSYAFADNGDDLVFRGECFGLQLGTSATGWTAGSNAVLKFTIQRSRSRIAMGRNAGRTTKYTATVAENVTGGFLGVPVTVEHVPYQNQTFTIEVLSGGTATEYVDAFNPGDFEMIKSSVTFGPTLAKTQSLTIQLKNDAAVEGDETIELGIVAAGQNALLNAAYQRHAQGRLAQVTIRSEDAAPGAPTGLGIAPSDTKLTVSWTAPVNVGSSALTGYDVHYTSAASGTVADDAAASGTDPSAAWVDAGHSGTSVTKEIPSLTNGTTYRVRVRALNASGGSAWVRGTATPSETPGVTLSASPNPVAEGSNVTITATVSRALSSSVTIPLTVERGSSEAGDHGTLSSITVNANATTGTGTVTTAQDTDADDETFTVALGSNLPSSVVAGSPSSVVVTITDDEEAPGAPEGLTVTPAAGVLGLQWRAPSNTGTSAITGYDARIKESSAPDAAATGGPSTGWVTTTTTATSIDFSGLTNGTAHEVQVRASNASGSGAWTARVSGTPRVAVTVSASPNPVDEGSNVTVTVTLAVQLFTNVTVPVTVTAGSAETGDYTVGSGTNILVQANSLSASSDLIATNHDTDEDDETFTVALGTLPAALVAGTPSSVEVTISDDEGIPAVSLSASPNPVDEGSSVTITATLSKAPASDVTIPLTLTDGTAESTDHGTLSSITVAGGATTGEGSIWARHDTDTDHETFTVAVDADNLPAEVRAGNPSSVEVTISDDDKAEVTLEASPNPVDEGSNVTVTARLSKALPSAVTIPLSLSRGTAEEGDFGALESITVRAGRTSATGTVATVRDEDEEDETFTVAVDAANLPSSALAGDPSSVEVTITDDGPLRAELTSSTLRPSEGSTARLTATLNHPAPEGGVRVRFHGDGGSGDNPAYPVSDFTLSPAPAGNSVTQWIGIAEGERRATAWLRVVNDDEPEDDETIAVWVDGSWTNDYPEIELTIPANDGGGGTGSAAWIDAEPNPVTEGRDVTIRVQLTKALEADATIPLTVSRGTSEEGDHGTLEEIVISAGATMGTGTIETTRDDDADDETFTVRLGRLPTGVRAGTASSVTVVIDDRDEPRAWLEVEPNPVAEGQPVTVTAKLNGTLSRSVTIPIEVERVTSEQGDHGTLSSIRIASGRTEGTGRITTRKDDDGDDETFTVSLGELPSGVEAGHPESVEVVIVDEGGPEIPTVSLAAAPNPVAEGESVTVTATLTKALISSVTIPVEVERGTSESGDHGSLSSIRIASGATEGTGTITTRVDDDTDDETFTVALRSNLPAGVEAGSPSSVTVTIADRGGEAPGRVSSLRVTAGDTRLDLAWSAPSTGTVTAYETGYKKRSASEWTTLYEDNYSDTKAAIEALENGTRYDVRVRATNDYGVGAWATGSGTPAGGGSANELRSLSVRVSKDDATYSSVSLSPSFRASVTAYRVTAPAGTQYAKFRPGAVSSTALILVDGHEVASGAESPAISVSTGVAYWIAVIPADNSEAKEYSVTFTIPAASADANGRSVTAAVDAALAVVGTLSPEDAAGALFGERSLEEQRLDALDRLGNANGRYDVGDLLAWIERCRAGGAKCGMPPRTPPPASDAALPGAIGAAAKRPRRRPPGRTRPKRRRTLRGLAVLLAAALWSCDGGVGLTAPEVLEPGTLAVEWTATAGGPAAAGALVEIDGPHVGDARAPGLELYESEGTGPRRFVIAGDMRDGPVLEFEVSDRRQAGLYSVRVVEVAGEDHRLLDAGGYRAEISSN